MTGAVSKLLRWRLALLNGVAAACGYLLYPAAIDNLTLAAAFGATALLAAGGSALNQVLEHDLDSRMERTRQRPIPSGILPVRAAAIIGGSIIGAGFFWLALAGNGGSLLSGAGALLWYLLVYTPLKRRTSLALPIGAICGALPPLIGWTLAGGAMSDHRIILLAGIMFLWQMPHFWLLQRRYADDYRAAGLPLCRSIAGSGTAPLTALWVTALLTAALLLPAFHIVTPQRAIWFLLLLVPLIPLAFLRFDRLLRAGLNLFPLLLALAVRG